MNDLKNKKILLIACPYHNYYQCIADNLKKRGANVILFDDEPKIFLYYKLLYSRFYQFFLIKKIIRHKEDIKRKKIIKIIQNELFDYVLVIKGIIINEAFISKIKKNNPNAKFILYQWDSMINYDYKQMILLFDKVFSFDYDDCKNYNLEYLPLFYNTNYENLSKDPLNNYKKQAFFLGVSHSNRRNILENISKVLESLNYNYKFLLMTNFTGALLQIFRKKKYIEFYKPKKFKDFFKEYRDSNVIIDVSSPHQSGLPIRIIEALGADKKIITTNINIKKEKFYNPNLVFIWGHDDINYLNIFLHNNCSSSSIIKDYSIESFTSKLIYVE